ncbi:MAG TPA: hypothetical protein VND64_07800 [Pirellulales bacterium]|nr:hypothetical protein [Pirellulales bacterium]
MKRLKPTTANPATLDAVPSTWHVPPELLRLRGIRRDPLLAYIVLWHVAGQRPRRLTVDYLRFEAIMAASERAVRGWIATLEARGLIQVEERRPRQAIIRVCDWRTAPPALSSSEPVDSQLELPFAGDDAGDDATNPIPIWQYRQAAARRPNSDSPQAS